MKEIGFVTPNYPNETRVALLPKDVKHLCSTGILPIIEAGFGAALNIPDADYISEGALITDRRDVFSRPIIFSLKLIQPVDYDKLQKEQTIIGWTHPTGSGRSFALKKSRELRLKIVDIDSVFPRLYVGDIVKDISAYPPHPFWKNSMYAGMASVRLGCQHFGLSSKSQNRVAVLGAGSVAQGAMIELARLGFLPRMFYRKTLSVFLQQLSKFDLIVNGIEIDMPGTHILSRAQVASTLPECQLIDAAADAGGAIEGTEYQSLSEPVGILENRRYILVNNAPTIMCREASENISHVISRDILWQTLEWLNKNPV